MGIEPQIRPLIRPLIRSLIRPLIRSFTDADYESVVTIDNAVYPDYIDTAEEWRFRDAHRDPHRLWIEYAVELERPVEG